MRLVPFAPEHTVVRELSLTKKGLRPSLNRFCSPYWSVRELSLTKKGLRQLAPLIAHLEYGFESSP